ncbi:FliG C-terminal domain-containing protein, partial [Candidatus Latescibacterota bacterium]
DNGQVWLCHRKSVLVQGAGAVSTPVYPDFLEGERNFFEPTIQRLLDAFDSGEEPASSGHDLRQSLEIGIAIKLSAAKGHERVSLPLEDRSHRLLPHPYRLHGGDVAGWESIGYAGPPEVPINPAEVQSFEDLARLSRHDIQLTMREVEQKDLVLALLDCSPMLKKRILMNMSERVRGYITDELSRTEATPEEIAAAQAGIIEVVGRL